MPGSGPCLLCGTSAEPTVEHIIPRTLWKRFGIDPDRPDLARFRTTLCNRHNEATSKLHVRSDMMKLIETGELVTRKTLDHLSDWAIWVTLLFALERGSGVLGPEASRELLLRRFDTDRAGPPKGFRVYAAKVASYVEPADPRTVPYVLALQSDSRITLDAAGEPNGFTIREGPINASESIGLGKLVLLVVGLSFPSGPDHNERLDEAAAQVGLERIHPPGRTLPTLTPASVNMTDISKVFTVLPIGADPSLLPKGLQNLFG
ncbi:hypothetical protein [Nocardioides sp. YR527]|uniref:hypothetical protein n=1 Tax=Nocardioides sp. YR527 TaxID=1881028 RepID=UPI0021095692|nr:hypothetical protein [Nocardioides sp. YR527]